jgi:predicted GTPase
LKEGLEISWVLVGNKVDLEDQISITKNEIESKYDGIEYFDCSAKHDVGINELMDAVCQSVIGNMEINDKLIKKKEENFQKEKKKKKFNLISFFKSTTEKDLE